MDTRRELLEALRWQIEAGADEAVGDRPVDHFNPEPEAPEPAPEPAAPPKPAPAAPPLMAPAAAEAPRPARGPGLAEAPAGRSAHEVAAAAGSVAELRAALEGFDGCPLRDTATNLVFTDGNPEAEILFIGEAPGAEEDRQGLPFVGPAGKLLDRMLDAIGLDRRSVLIGNILFWRPPGNRNPTPAEVAACLPFVERLVELNDPKLLVLVGGIAAKTLLATKEGIMKLRGRWFTFETARMSHPIDTTAIYHPAFLLRSPGRKREAWRDLIEIRKHLDGRA